MPYLPAGVALNFLLADASNQCFAYHQVLRGWDAGTTIEDMKALPAYTVSQIRAAEDELFATMPDPDYLMRQAAHATATAAQHLLTASTSHPAQVLLLVGPGGNGGDALYAGALLQAAGMQVAAIQVASKVYRPAAAVFEEAGGTWCTTPPAADLVIDGIYGIGGRAGLPDAICLLWEEIQQAAQQEERNLRLLAVDLLSGIEADSGECTALPDTWRATVTVTFGGLRIAHTCSSRSGQVLLADLEGGASNWLSTALANQSPTPPARLAQVVAPQAADWPAPLYRPAYQQLEAALEPAADDDKYTGGVVGICAGSETYPGAAILATTAAVRATRSLVRYAGACHAQVIQANPEVVATANIASAGRVQAWVYGPGAADTPGLADLLQTDTPLLIDADGITALAADLELRRLLQQRSAVTVLTPHAGEAQRLADAVGLAVDSKQQRWATACSLAQHLDCIVLLKGRVTLIAPPEGTVQAVDAGHSRAATAGSGDILAGIIGAWLAKAAATAEQAGVALDTAAALVAVTEGVIIHAEAAYLAGESPAGVVPVHASAINEQVGVAVARCARQ